MQIIILLLTLSTPSYAYDGKIKDKYGRVSGYLDKDGDKT